jgi:hypothetical protein
MIAARRVAKFKHSRFPLLLLLLVTVSTTPEIVNASETERSLEGRHRLELRAGFWDAGMQQSFSVTPYRMETTRVENVAGAFSYAYWVNDRVATDITLKGMVAGVTSVEWSSGVTDSAVVLASATFGVRLYPISSARSPLRPYITAAVGPFLGVESHKEINFRVSEYVRTLGTVGGYLGGGVDFQMGHHMMAGIHVGYNVMADFPETLGLERNFSGVEFSAGISLLI